MRLQRHQLDYLQSYRIKKQSGSVLITSLLIIIALTLLVLSASRSTTLQQKMANNLRERDLAFQSAETALLAGEKYLRDTEPLPAFDGNAGLHLFSQTRQFKQDSDWDNISPISYTHSLFQTTAAPEYVLEKIFYIDTVGESLDSSSPVVSNYYRVTSRSKNHNATVVIQGIYRR